MSSEPLAVAVYSAYEPHSVNERPLRTHELLEGELSRFAKFIVVQGGVKLIGWPSDIPYVRFSHIRGGIATLRKLLALWNDRKIRFVRATSEDIANAKRDPRTVLPSSLNNFDSSSYFGTMETKLDAFTATVADGARAEGN